MTRLERRVRLEQIMEVSPSALQEQEGFRCLALQRENCFLYDPKILSTGNSPCSDEDIVNRLLSRHHSVADLGGDLLEMSLL
jgi:hypothetical protein